MKIINNHAPLKKFTVEAKCAPWIDTSLKNLMAKRDEAKKVAVLSCSTEDLTYYRMLRNQVTKMNRIKKRSYCQQQISDSSNDCKKLWSVLNEIIGKKPTCTSFVESEGAYLTSQQLFCQ